MVRANSENICLDAELYYYDFLEEETKECIPCSTLEHIAQCRRCQAEIERLKAFIEVPDRLIDLSQYKKNVAITSLLELHFAYVGKAVDCGTVKPFLPNLADPKLTIKIPTPITAHIDRCPACLGELQAIRDMKLTHRQLCRLSQILADEPSKDASDHFGQ